MPIEKNYMLPTADDIFARVRQGLSNVPVFMKEQKFTRARRSHRKSRAGCTVCKMRRVKCDENRPSCLNCQSRGTSCSYSPEASDQKNRTDVAAIDKPDRTTFSLALADIATRIDGLLGRDLISNGSPVAPNAAHCLNVVAFQHFINCSTDTVANPAIRAIIKSDMIRVSFTIFFQSPYLMYTILAVGILHLNRISPGNNMRRYTEMYYWQRAIELYRAALTSRVTCENVNALLSTCMFMGLLTLYPEDIKPSDSWVLSDKPDAMNWIYLQSGPRHIRNLAGSYFDSSIWATAFQQARNQEAQLYHGVEKGREGLDPDLADLCEIDEFSSVMTNPYYKPLRNLTSLFRLERNFKSSGLCATFIGRLENEFLVRLRKRDTPALLILAQWMGLMCAMSQWQPWIRGRIYAELIAICSYLERSSDPRVLRLLKFPASACGYVSRNIL